MPIGDPFETTFFLRLEPTCNLYYIYIYIQTSPNVIIFSVTTRSQYMVFVGRYSKNHQELWNIMTSCKN